MITAGGAWPVPTGFEQSADAQVVKEACGPITCDAVGSSLSAPPVLTRVGHKLFKYLRLISGPVDVRSGFDSVVDDLLIHLLDSLGFNDGPLSVLSNNSLRLRMNDQDIYASTDVTVYDDNSHFRLAVTKHKREPVGSFNAGAHLDLGIVEAQLIAGAMAAAQYNRNITDSVKRSRSASEDGAVGARKGDYFSFYSVSFDESLLEMVEDYSQRDELALDELPPTTVWNLAIGAAAAAGQDANAAGRTAVTPTTAASPSPPSSSSPALRSSVFNFAVAEERAIIIDVLDRIRHVLLHGQV